MDVSDYSLTSIFIVKKGTMKQTKYFANTHFQGKGHQ